MKKSTTTVVCSFAALFYFLICTIPVLMWMDRTSAKHAWFWEPVTQSEIWASRLIFGEVMAIAFLPLIVFFVLAFTAWRDHNREHFINPNNDSGGNTHGKRPPAPPSYRPPPSPPVRRPPPPPSLRSGPPPPRHGMTAATA
jgi:hypothetical protein